MLLYSLLGLLMGIFIPAIAGRFGKLIPMEPGLILLKLPHIPRFPKVKDSVRQKLLAKKWKKLLFISLLWGIVEAILFSMCAYFFPSFSIWGGIFCWIVSVLIVIDSNYWLLPDFFTIPLFLLGFSFSLCQKEIDPKDALIGAICGYFISVVSVFLMGLFSKKTQFGGGDMKMLIAIGSWLGILGLNYALILSFVLFMVLNSLPIQKKGAYGPALGIASIVVFFVTYLK